MSGGKHCDKNRWSLAPPIFYTDSRFWWTGIESYLPYVLSDFPMFLPNILILLCPISTLIDQTCDERHSNRGHRYLVCSCSDSTVANVFKKKKSGWKTFVDTACSVIVTQAISLASDLPIHVWSRGSIITLLGRWWLTTGRASRCRKYALANSDHPMLWKQLQAVSFSKPNYLRCFKFDS